jgi:phosphate transport system permease protein
VSAPATQPQPLSPEPPRAPPKWKPQSLAQRVWERLVEFYLLCCGLLSIGITLGIAGVVLYGSAQFFRSPDVSLKYFLTGSEWTAGFRDPPPVYGILPLLVGTLMVALIAALVAIPIGVTTAVYLSEYASPRLRKVVKPTLELLAGIPTVVYGFFALNTVTPFLRHVFPSIDSLNQLSGGIVVGIMILPMVASLSEDAIRAVPRALREGSYALGATQFETSTRVVVPAALSGITASFILAISRAIGETMAVSMACGGTAQLTANPLKGAATMTGFIARISLGDVQHGSTDFNSLFAVAGTLFLMTLSMNVFAQWMLKRFRQVYQ